MKHLLAVILISALTLSGCALKPGESHQAVRYYDLGGTLFLEGNCRMNVQLGRIRTHPTLQGSRMWFRLESSPFEYSPLKALNS